MTRHVFTLGLIVWMGSFSLADDKPVSRIDGRVVDVQGRPVANVDVSTYWSANGWKVDNLGKNLGSVDTDADVARFWSHVGQMEPTGKPIKTAADGTFQVSITGTRIHHVLAMDSERVRGGLGILPLGQEGQPITIKLEPLVRVQGQIRGLGSDQKPRWTHVYTLRAEEPERPADFYRIAGCGSFQADFVMLLPPGKYQLHAYDEAMTGEVLPYPGLTIDGSVRSIDLGTLMLTPIPEALVPHLKRIKAEKHLPELKDYVNQPPPPIFADDARGVPKDWQPGRAPGKWQVIEFWGKDCPSCISRIIPDLVRFHEEHAAQADRFEIISVFIDSEGKTRTINEMDEALKSIVKYTWGGKAPPFPTLVDPSLRTAESFGLSGYGEMILINPEGKIVAGDLATLRDILASK